MPKVSVSSAAPLGKSDHVLFTGNIPVMISKTTAKPSRLVWCWNKANFQGLQQLISTENWSDVLDCSDNEMA